MRTTDHQLAEGVCESIATTTPRFTPPSRTTSVWRHLVGWIAASIGVLLIVAIVIGLGG